MSGTDLRVCCYQPLSFPLAVPHSALSPYARAMQCPVLTYVYGGTSLQSRSTRSSLPGTPFLSTCYA
eukprot:1787835-Rhodomonas_salina.1